MKKIKKIKFSKKDLNKLIPCADKSCNKYTRGSAIFLAGSKTFPGAAILACRSAQKIGSGYTKLYTNKDVVKLAAFSMPSCPVSSFEEFETIKDFNNAKPHAYVVGPGFEVENDYNKDMCLQLLTETLAPVVIDGGAISTIEDDAIKDCFVNREKNNASTILTPHMGEALRIFSYYNKNMPNNQGIAAKELAQLTKCIVVLKDSNTYVCNSKQIYYMKGENPALAKAGSGDVLAGIIGGILCQNKTCAFNSCVLAINIHAKAAKLASKEIGEISVIPEDVINYIAKSMVL